MKEWSLFEDSFLAKGVWITDTNIKEYYIKLNDF